MGKKLIVLLLMLSLFLLLSSCNLSNLFKGKEEKEVQQEEQVQQSEEPPAETKPTEQKVEEKPTQPKPKEPEKQPSKTTTTETTTKQEEPKEEAKQEEQKVPKAGLGVIFITNIRTGVFRVKMDDEKIYEQFFQGRKSGKAEELRFEKEFKFEPGSHKFKFVCEDNQGSRGIKELDLNFQPGQHKVIKITAKGAPGDIKLEMIE